MRGGGAEVNVAEVIVADEPELALAGLAGLAGSRVVIVGLVTGLLVPHALPVAWLASLQVVRVFVPGVRTRVMPCRALVHNFPPLPAMGRAGMGYLPGPAAP